MTHPVTPYTWTLDGMEFGTGDGNYLPRVLGWQGRPAPRMNRVDKVGTDGVHLGGSYTGPRVVEISGAWLPPSRDARDAAIDALTALCSSGDRLTEYRLSREEGTRARFTWCKLDDELLPRVGPSGLITWDTQLLCPDYRWWSMEAVEWQPVGLAAEAGGGILWNGSTGTSGDGILWNGSTGTSGDGILWDTGSAGGGVVAVENLGNDFTPVRFRITATGGSGLLSPYVSLGSANGPTIQYNGLLPVGSYVDVDTGTGRVQLNGSNAPGVLSRSEFFELSPNTSHQIVFGSNGLTDQGLLTGSHYHAYQGG